METFRVLVLDQFVERTDRHTRTSGDQDDRIVSDCADNATEVKRSSASDAVKSQCSNSEL